MKLTREQLIDRLQDILKRSSVKPWSAGLVSDVRVIVPEVITALRSVEGREDAARKSDGLPADILENDYRVKHELTAAAAPEELREPKWWIQYDLPGLPAGMGLRVLAKDDYDALLAANAELRNLYAATSNAEQHAKFRAEAAERENAELRNELKIQDDANDIMLRKLNESERKLAEREGFVMVPEDVIDRIKSWSEAYPLSVFPEPDFEKARKLLTAGGMTIDAVSASNMRHVITKVWAMLSAAPKREDV